MAKVFVCTGCYRSYGEPDQGNYCSECKSYKYYDWVDEDEEESIVSTPILSRAEILAELWLEYKNDEEFADFIEYNDLGLPLAYSLANGIIEANDQVINFINETFDLLLSVCDLEDEGFEALEEILENFNGSED